MQITKVKLIKGGDSGLEISTVKTELNKSTTKANEEHSAPVHVDLKGAMKAIAIHFGILSDYIKVKDVKNIERYDTKLIEDFVVTGFSVKGDEEDRGVVITGMKKKANGKFIIINTPFTRFIEAEGSEYVYIEQLQDRINEVEREVKAYLGGKVAPDPQQSFDFPEHADEQDNAFDEADVVEEDDHADDLIKVKADSKAAKPKKSAAKKTAKKTTTLKKSSSLKKVD